MDGLPLPDSSTLQGRVLWLLDHHYRGSQREMSRDLGLPQPTISRIVRGLQEPGRRVMETIAANPKFNKVWLFSGEGKPTSAAGQDPAPARDDRMLPITEEILPGKRSGLTRPPGGTYFPVTSEHFGEERYWLQYSAAIECSGGANGAILPGDLLLMESDPKYWKGGADSLVGCICALRVFAQNRTHHLLTVFGVDFEWAERKYQYQQERGGTGYLAGMVPRPIIFEDTLEPIRPHLVTPGDVVALRLLLVRR